MIKLTDILNEINDDNLTVYRGQPSDVIGMSPRKSIWVTYNINFAKEYGNVVSYKLPKNLNILNTEDYPKWESLIDDFGGYGDYEEYKYEPDADFISYLEYMGYDGFENGDNILIFDKSVLK